MRDVVDFAVQFGALRLITVTSYSNRARLHTVQTNEHASAKPPVQTASLATFRGGVLTDLLAGLAANSIGLAKSFFPDERVPAGWPLLPATGAFNMSR